jgi:hypothetical protein
MSFFSFIARLGTPQTGLFFVDGWKVKLSCLEELMSVTFISKVRVLPGNG